MAVVKDAPQVAQLRANIAHENELLAECQEGLATAEKDIASFQRRGRKLDEVSARSERDHFQALIAKHEANIERLTADLPVVRAEAAQQRRAQRAQVEREPSWAKAAATTRPSEPVTLEAVLRELHELNERVNKLERSKGARK